MPHWVKNFDCISIRECDPTDIKVFKVRLNVQFMGVSMCAILSSMTCSISTMVLIFYCLKKFLQGDAEYRRLRMQFLPVLVDGPFAVRMIAPEKKELIGRATLMSPFSWYTENESIDRSGCKRCALMEASVDVTTSYLSRTATNILRRFIDSVHLDVAFVIDQPELQNEFEPSCIIGLCQVKNVNVNQCALLPIDNEDTTLKVSNFISQMKLG